MEQLPYFESWISKAQAKRGKDLSETSVSMLTRYNCVCLSEGSILMSRYFLWQLGQHHLACIRCIWTDHQWLSFVSFWLPVFHWLLVRLSVCHCVCVTASVSKSKKERKNFFLDLALKDTGDHRTQIKTNSATQTQPGVCFSPFSEFECPWLIIFSLFPFLSCTLVVV